MTLDTVLNLLGLTISVGGLVAAKLTRQAILAIFACALIATTGAASWLTYQDDREISRIESKIKARLSNNRWTLERIRSEMGDADYKVLREALSRAVENGTVSDESTECIVSNGSVLSTRVYFNTVRQ